MTLFVALALLMPAGAFAMPSALAKTSAAADADASTIRVMLSTDNTVSVLPFSVSGVYSIVERPDLFRLPEGKYTVTNAGGKLTLTNTDTKAVITADLGTITIKEHVNEGGTNLITLVAKGSSKRYPGSMKFWPDSTHVDAVNHVYLERYLYGVVANEMGSSFPLEALKAQTVAARCYALKALEGTRGTKSDITDYGSTQAYSGYTTNAKIIQAVDETSKQVLTYGGSVISAYYAASNGGQTDRTENVWSAALGYFKIRDDPYDLVKGPKETVYFPVGTTSDKPSDMPTLPLQPLALGEAYNASYVKMYQRPDTGSTRILSLSRGTRFFVYEMNSAWVKAKVGDKVGFIPTRYTRIYNLQASTIYSNRKLMPKASTSGTAVAVLPLGAKVTLLTYGTWCKVSYNGKQGYIQKSYLKFTPHAAPAKVVLEPGNTLTTTTSVYLRTTASTKSKALALLSTNKRVTLVSAGAEWIKVTYGTKTGYMMGKYLQLVIPSLVLTSDGYGDTPAPGNSLRYTEDDIDPKITAFLKTSVLKELTAKNATLPGGQKYYLTAESVKVKGFTKFTPVQTNHRPYCLHNANATDGPAHTAANCPSKDFTGLKLTVVFKVLKENAAKQGGFDRLDYTWNTEFYIPEVFKSSDHPEWKVFKATSTFRIFAVERGVNAGGIDSYLLINRRWGHGIGMSQWGAYQRALSTDTAVNRYTAILAFYYANTTLATLDIAQAPLDPVPTPTPTPTPEPTPIEAEPTPTTTPTQTPSATTTPGA
jgi:peptidoglycan hydrolase-like amidase